jgi:hypothetical protein
MSTYIGSGIMQVIYIYTWARQYCIARDSQIYVDVMASRARGRCILLQWPLL